MKDVDRLRAALFTANAKELERIALAFYQTVFQATEADREALAALLTQEGVTRSKIEQSAVFKRLVRNTDTALGEYASFLLVDLKNINALNVERGLVDGTKMIDLVSAMLGVPVQPRNLPANAVAQALDLLKSDGALYSRLKLYPGYNAESIAQAILSGVYEGRNPIAVANDLRKLYGVPLNDALRITRTAQIYSYRRATQVNYAANSDVVSGWVWYARLDGNTCMSCVNMHGSIHGHDEELNDHHQGRCTPVPVLFGFNPVAETGQQWFDVQDETLQKSMMGKAAHAAWTDGKITIDQLTAIRPDEVYGEMRVQTPLKSILP